MCMKLVSCLALFLVSCSHTDPQTGKTVKGMSPAHRAFLEQVAQDAIRTGVQAGVSAVVSGFGPRVNRGK